MTGQTSLKMMGAIVGDTAGSPYEWHNIKHKISLDEMATGRARFTDDSVMTCAVADGMMNALGKLSADRSCGRSNNSAGRFPTRATAAPSTAG